MKGEVYIIGGLITTGLGIAGAVMKIKSDYSKLLNDKNNSK